MATSENKQSSKSNEYTTVWFNSLLYQQIKSFVGSSRSQFMILSNPQFNNKNIRYILTVFISPYDEPKNSFLLSDEKIQRIEIFNKLNQFYTSGSLTYIDDEQKIDKIFSKPIATIHMSFEQIIFDPSSKVDIAKPKENFYHDFLVKKVDIKKREGQRVTYQIEFVDVNWWKMNKNVTYTNYQDKSICVYDILKESFKQSGLKLTPNNDTFTTKLDYITYTNDNVMTIFKYLMQKTIYKMEHEESIGMLSYNFPKDEYFFYNLQQKINKPAEDLNSEQNNLLYLSMYDVDSLETMIQKQESGLGTISFFDNMQMIDNMKLRIFDDYDLASNTFTQVPIFPDTIQNIMNKSKFNDAKKIDISKFNIIDEKKIMDNPSFQDGQPYWNNVQNIYDGIIEATLNNNSLVVSVGNGNMLRVPGQDFYILIRNPDDIKDIPADQNEFLKKKYENIMGIWAISSVRHIIEPAKSTFTDVVCLFRNW